MHKEKGYSNQMENKYRDSMKDYPAPASHNIVFASNTVPLKMAAGTGSWDGNNVAFIGEVFSEWKLFADDSELYEYLNGIVKTHKIRVEEITVVKR